MGRFKRLAPAGVGLIFGLSLAIGSGAQAGEPDSEIDQDVLDAIRAQILEGSPGEFDLTEADEEFGQLVSLFGESTEVGDFGTESVLTGPCGGYAYSYDEDGQLLDAALDFGGDSPPVDLLDGGAAFTADNPFKVDTRGVVTYFGFMPEAGDGPMNHSWHIKTSGISLDKGGDPNSAGNNRNTGLVDLANDLPIKFSATVRVEGQLMSDNLAACIGKGHVEFIGKITDPVGVAALVLFAGGIFGLLFNARPAMTYKVG